MAQEPRGHVLPFDRSAAELRQLAQRQLEQGQALKAVELLRLSLEKAPDDPETIFTIAETYASMGCLSLSNSAFFSLTENEEYAPHSFYGMGANYYAMQMFGAAHDCLVMALQKLPDASFVGEAVDMLDAIDDMRRVPDLDEDRLQKRMERVLAAMDEGRAKLAVRQLRRVSALDRRSSGIQSLQAFANLAAGDADGAMKAARRALMADNRDIRALCAVASACHAKNSRETARKYLQKAETLIEQPDDAQLVCQTACEIGEHAFAAALLERIESRMPYAEDVLHPLALALYNAGKTDEAMRCWRLLRRINPMDSIAEYRLHLVEVGKPPAEIAYTSDVPLSEVLERLERLRKWVHKGPEAFTQQWNESNAMECLLRWGIASAEPGVPQAMCGVLTTLGDERAQSILKDVLCNANATEAVKQSALAALYSLGQNGPFYAVMDDRLTLVHVSRSEKTTQAERSEAQRKIWEAACAWMHDGADAAAREKLQRLSAAAVVLAPDIENGLKARAVVLAYCTLRGIQAPFSSTFSKHRKAERLAARLIKGDDENENYQF